MNPIHIDAPRAVRSEETLRLPALAPYLQTAVPGFGKIISVAQFPGGFSNLTYLLQTDSGTEYVLRRPPVGANIKSAHDMGREYRVLKALQPFYAKIPAPYCLEETGEIIGAPFYVMERVKGIILRAKDAAQPELTPSLLRALSEKLVDNLADLHALDIEKTGLIQLGKPDGYVERQVEGWIKRYAAAQTDEITDMTDTAAWMRAHLPRAQKPAFLHNDYKYDNVVLNPENWTEILAVLDWEMSTVGDPLMDLGAMLAYWSEPGDGDAMRQFNLTWREGNLTRREVIDRYALRTGRDMTDISFYYVFGLFKNAVIAQQIYARWKQGHSEDARFGELIYWVKELAGMAARSAQ